MLPADRQIRAMVKMASHATCAGCSYRDVQQAGLSPTPSLAARLGALGARISQLVRAPGRERDAAATGVVRMSAEEVLTALPSEAPPELRAAIKSGCCTHYTVAEGQCIPGGCGAGRCCYHIVSAACAIDQYQCLTFPCSKGNFSLNC
jgi:hypothetical protein